jgi:hypothetical protein
MGMVSAGISAVTLSSVYTRRYNIMIIQHNYDLVIIMHISVMHSCLHMNMMAVD